MPIRHLAFAISLSLFAGLAEAQTAVRIVAVPERILLPAAEGTNLLLEVECTTPPDSIWLASEELARDSVPLQASGNGRYQLNLADARVASLVPSSQKHGELFVFAKAGGQVAKSAAVAWSRRLTAPGLRCQLRKKDGVATAAGYRRPAWIDTQRDERIEIVGDPARDGTMVLCAGSLQAELEPATDLAGWQLPIAKLPPEALEAGAFAIEVRGQGAGREGPFHFRLVPRRLDLPGEGAELRVQQRTSVDVPGARQWLQVRIGDVTGGRVETFLESADDRTVVPRRRMFERDSVEFALADGRYVLTLDRLVNQLIGDDHAEFTVRSAEAFVPDRIGQLLHAVEASRDTFLRDEEEVDGDTTMQVLLAKVSGQSGRKVTVDRFVDELASKSSKTGEPHRVKRVDGTVVTMQQWLRDELRRLEAAEAKAGTKQDGKGPSEQPPAGGKR